MAKKALKPVEGDAVALTNKGHRVTKLQRKPRPASRKGRINRHVKLCRDIVREVRYYYLLREKIKSVNLQQVVGMAPYERRAIELLRIGKDKKAGKFLKARVRFVLAHLCKSIIRLLQIGSLRRAKRKRDELQSILTAQRKAKH